MRNKTDFGSHFDLEIKPAFVLNDKQDTTSEMTDKLGIAFEEVLLRIRKLVSIIEQISRN